MGRAIASAATASAGTKDGKTLQEGVKTAIATIRDAVASRGGFEGAPLLAEAGADAAEAIFATPEGRSAAPAPAPEVTKADDAPPPSPIWRALAVGYAPLLTSLAEAALSGSEHRAPDSRVAANHGAATLIYASAFLSPLATALTDEAASAASAVDAVVLDDGTASPPSVAAAIHGAFHRAMHVSHAPMLVACMRLAASLAEAAASPLATDQAPHRLLIRTASSPSVWHLLLEPSTRDALTAIAGSARNAGAGDASAASASVLLSWLHKAVSAGARGMRAASALPGAPADAAACASSLESAASKGPWGEAPRAAVATAVAQV